MEVIAYLTLGALITLGLNCWLYFGKQIPQFGLSPEETRIAEICTFKVIVILSPFVLVFGAMTVAKGFAFVIRLIYEIGRYTWW